MYSTKMAKKANRVIPDSFVYDTTYFTEMKQLSQILAQFVGNLG